VWHGKLGAIFWIGPFLIIAGGLWFVSDWFAVAEKSHSFPIDPRSKWETQKGLIFTFV
jgi:hypothetical protein